MTSLVADTPFQDVAYGTGCLYVGAGIYQALAVRLADCIGEGEGRGGGRGGGSKRKPGDRGGQRLSKDCGFAKAGGYF